ncbi:MAG TPA: polysaccharide deacetylase family protein [Acidobacteriota bacterium]|nr:polysaccharide deacetylase family protein [Acidobacteriota bacterium]
MSLARHLKHFLKTKGALHGVERTAEVLRRFSRGRERFRRDVAEFEDFFTRRGFRLTFCVTSSLVKRHADLLHALQDQGHEIAAHGHIHTRMDQYDFRRQQELVDTSWRVLSEAGFVVSGFRAPYLNFNDDTIRALQASRFEWTSGEMVWWEDGGTPTGDVERLRSLYRFINESDDGVYPVWDGTLVHLPITAPDDELLFERWKIRDEDRLAEVWLEIFHRHHARGGFHHQYFHPERFPLVRCALDRLLEQVASLGDAVWKPTLGELARWWRAHAPASQPSAPTRRTAGISPVVYDTGKDARDTGMSVIDGTCPTAPLPETGNLKPDASLVWPHGARSCFVLSADVCAVDLRDFLDRALHF